MEKKFEIKGFSAVSEQELESVDGGWIWEVFGTIAVVVAATILTIEAIRN